MKNPHEEDVSILAEAILYPLMFYTAIAVLFGLASLMTPRDIPVSKPVPKTNEKVEWDPLSPLSHQEGGLREYK